MRAQLVAFAPDTLDDVGVVVDAAQAAAVKEEGAWDAVGTEEVQQRGGEHVWAIVEGQGYGAGDAAMVDDGSEGDGGAPGVEGLILGDDGGVGEWDRRSSCD